MWNMHEDVRAAAGKSFACWRDNKSQPRMNERRAAIAMAISEDARMTSLDREEMTIEAWLRWLQERILGSMVPPKPWAFHLIFEE
jgi:hypothetical protein